MITIDDCKIQVTAHEASPVVMDSWIDFPTFKDFGESDPNPWRWCNVHVTVRYGIWSVVKVIKNVEADSDEDFILGTNAELYNNAVAEGYAELIPILVRARDQLVEALKGYPL